MINLIGKIPVGEFGVACSGGIDSIAVLDFIVNGKRNPYVLFFNHLSDSSQDEYEVVSKYCHLKGLKLYTGFIQRERKKNESLEEYWRNERYLFLESFDMPVITCHHLNDVAETWLFSSLNGTSKLIPYKRNNIIRPFLLTEKEKFIQWVNRHNLQYVDDKSNNNMNLKRNYIRKNLMPHALNVNPGLLGMLRKKIIEKNLP